MKSTFYSKFVATAIFALLTLVLLAPSVLALNNVDTVALLLKPTVNGSIIANQTYSYNFIFSDLGGCTNILLNASTNVTTNNQGEAVQFVNISTVTVTPLFMCEYRNGTNTFNHTLNRNFFETNNVSMTVTGTTAFSWASVQTASGTLWTLQTQNASATLDGILKATDWAAFNNGATLATAEYGNITGLQSANASAITRSDSINVSLQSLGNWTLDKTSYSTTAIGDGRWGNQSFTVSCAVGTVAQAFALNKDGTQNATTCISYGTQNLPAANITSGTFGSGDYVFPRNVTITGNLTVGTGSGRVCSNSTSLILCSPGATCPC